MCVLHLCAVAQAAPLLRQLLDSGTLTREHRVLVFEALRAAFPIDASQGRHLVDPVLRRYVPGCAELLRMPEAGWVLRNFQHKRSHVVDTSL